MNRLADATSPYLLQHAANPVDWQQWGEAPFAEARERDVPVLVSIGYAACHWCHVMAHESFEDAKVSAYLNEHFVAVKVDREERPDVDAVYLEVATALTGHAGWPLTVFTTPDGRPFYCGTYFPPEPRHGMPSFRQLLESVATTWSQRRDEVVAAGQRIVDGLAGHGLSAGSARRHRTPADLDDAVRSLASTYDEVHGGFGGAPKFPPSMVLELLAPPPCAHRRRGGAADGRRHLRGDGPRWHLRPVGRWLRSLLG